MNVEGITYRIKYERLLRTVDVLCIVLSLFACVAAYFIADAKGAENPYQFTAMCLAAVFIAVSYLGVLSFAFPEFGMFNEDYWNEMTKGLHGIWLAMTGMYAVILALFGLVAVVVLNNGIVQPALDLLDSYKYVLAVVAISYFCRLCYGVYHYIKHGTFVFRILR